MPPAMPPMVPGDEDGVLAGEEAIGVVAGVAVDDRLEAGGDGDGEAEAVQVDPCTMMDEVCVVVAHDLPEVTVGTEPSRGLVISSAAIGVAWVASRRREASGDVTVMFARRRWVGSGQFREIGLKSSVFFWATKVLWSAFL